MNSSKQFSIASLVAYLLYSAVITFRGQFVSKAKIFLFQLALRMALHFHVSLFRMSLRIFTTQLFYILNGDILSVKPFCKR